MINFKTSKEDHEKIMRIVERAEAVAGRYGVTYERMELVMDMTACHANGCPLDLDKLADAPDVDFAHDVFGIRNHIDRRTGVLMDCFLPRCAARYS